MCVATLGFVFVTYRRSVQAALEAETLTQKTRDQVMEELRDVVSRGHKLGHLIEVLREDSASTRALLDLQKRTLELTMEKLAELQGEVRAPFEWPEGTFGWAIRMMDEGHRVQCGSDPSGRKYSTALGMPLDLPMWATDWELVPLTVIEIMERCERCRGEGIGGNVTLRGGMSSLTGGSVVIKAGNAHGP